MAPNPNNRTDFGARRLLDAATVAELTGLDLRTARRMLDERRVPVVKVGRLVRVWSDDLAAYLDANTRPAREAVAR